MRAAIFLNGMLSAVAFGLCAWAVFSDRVRDGVVIKAGLIIMMSGFAVRTGAMFLGLADVSDQMLVGTELLVTGGMLVCVLGYCVRVRRTGHRSARLSDWLRS